jgi:general secretion pathway protein D
LLLAVLAASSAFAQVAPIAKPGQTPIAESDDDDGDEEDVVTPAPQPQQPPQLQQVPPQQQAQAQPTTQQQEQWRQAAQQLRQTQQLLQQRQPQNVAQAGRPSSMQSQQTAARPAPSVPTQVAAQPTAPQPARGQPGTTAQPGAPQMVRLQFPNSDVVDVLHEYELLTGKKLVMDNFVQGKVNIFIAKDVPRDEAIKIIEMNLLLNGYSLVPVEDSDIVKVIGTGKNPRTTGVPVVSDENQIPDGDHVISYLFKLRYADPQELQQALGQYLSPPQPYTSFLALPKAGAILVTENSSVIRMLTRIIDQIDVPPAEVVSEFIKLERADASKVVDMLKEIFEKQDKPTGGVSVRGVRPGQPNIPQPPETAELAGLTALTEESVVVGKIKISADVRTNRIHVITRPVNMPFVRKLIAEFDANVEFAKPVTRALNYISAADVLPVIVQALTEPGQAGGGGEGQPSAPGASATPSRRSTSYTQTGNGSLSSSTSGSTTAGTGGSGGTLNISEELSTQPVDTTPKAVVIGNAKIIADQRANTIIMLGNQEIVVKVQKILDEMDVKAPQVALSTVIGELTLNNDEEFGVDYFAKYDHKVVGTSRNTGVTIPNPLGSSGSSGGTGIVDPANLINFSQIITNVASGTNVYVAAGNYLATIVHALEGTGRFRVINRPVVFTSNNKKAIIASGTEIPVPVNTLTNVVNNVSNVNGTAAVASNIEFKRVALQLEVVPLINSEREVSLDILQKLDSLAGSTIVNGNSIPNIATRYVRTNVTAPNGSTIVLGGLITDSKRKDTTGIPVLDRIPYIGSLFRSTITNRSRSELIILMCPEVTMTNLELHKLREKVEDHTHFGPEIDQGYCPDCPPRATEEKELPSHLPPPDLPFGDAKVKSK